MTSLLATLVQPVLRFWLRRRADDEATMLRELPAERARDATPTALLKQGRARRADHDGMTVWEVGRPDAPRTVLYLHGGAYVARVQPAHWSFVADMATRLDARFVVPFYPLAPEHAFAEALPPVAALYDALRGEPLAVMGDSAGGGLAVSLLADRPAAEQPRALVLIAPWLDAAVADPSQPAIEPRDVMLSIARLRIAGRWWAGSLSPADPRITTADRSLPQLPPTLMLCGGDDILVADARRFAAANPAVAYDETADLCHVFPLLFFRESRRARARIAAFLTPLLT